jgi:hypothetical protein
MPVLKELNYIHQHLPNLSVPMQLRFVAECLAEVIEHGGEWTPQERKVVVKILRAISLGGEPQ